MNAVPSRQPLQPRRPKNAHQRVVSITIELLFFCLSRFGCLFSSPGVVFWRIRTSSSRIAKFAWCDRVLCDALLRCSTLYQRRWRSRHRFEYRATIPRYAITTRCQNLVRLRAVLTMSGKVSVTVNQHLTGGGKNGPKLNLLGSLYSFSYVDSQGVHYCIIKCHPKHPYLLHMNVKVHVLVRCRHPISKPNKPNKCPMFAL